MTLTTLLQKFPGARKRGKQWQARCPAHDDQEPSLSISEGADRRILLKCQAGCTTEAVCAVLSLTTADLFAEAKPQAATSQRKIAATYDYRDEAGTLLFQTVRFAPKGFSQRQPDGNSDWRWNLQGVRRVLYRLSELLATDLRATVFIPEGEKDVDRLRALGLVATCNPMGAGKWRDDYSEPLRGRPVVVIEDNDKAGREHAAQVARSLKGVAASVKVLRLPGLPEKGDVSDWLDAGGTVEQLRALAAACPEWTPATDTPSLSTADSESESDERPAREKKSQAERLIEVAEAADYFYCVEEDAAYASVTVSGHQETYRVNSKPFRQYLSRKFYLEERRVPNGEALQNALAILDGRARFEGQHRPVFLRLAAHEGRIYWDTANRDWQIIEISADGWRVIEAKDAPVRFRRTKGMLPLALPERGGDLGTLRRFINYPDAAAWVLHTAWLVAALRANARAFPVLILNGEQGSAKSTASKISRRLIDPNIADLRPKPREDLDLYLAARNGWVCAFDNLSGLQRDFSDSLCRLATGTGFGKRELYSDEDETLFQVVRPVVLNGIDDLADKADLVDRAIFIELPPIPDEERKDEETLWGEFEASLPGLIGALADAAAKALRELPNVRLEKLPRMADFAKWGVAAGIGGDGAFINAYTGNRTQANQLALRSNEIADCLIEWFADSDEPETVNLTDLLTQLNTICRERVVKATGCKPDKAKFPDGWPATEKKLANELRRCSPILRRAGIEIVDAGADSRTRKALRQFQRTTPTPNGAGFKASQPSHASQPDSSAEDSRLSPAKVLRSFAEGSEAEASQAADVRSFENGATPKASQKLRDGSAISDNGLGDIAKRAKGAKLPDPDYSESARRKVVRI